MCSGWPAAFPAVAASRRRFREPCFITDGGWERGRPALDLSARCALDGDGSHAASRGKPRRVRILIGWVSLGPRASAKTWERQQGPLSVRTRLTSMPHSLKWVLACCQNPAAVSGAAVHEFVAATIGTAAEFLDIDVDQVPGSLVFMAANAPSGGLVQPRQPRHPVPGEDLVHSGGLQLQQASGPGRPPTPVHPQADDPPLGPYGSALPPSTTHGPASTGPSAPKWHNHGT